MYSLHEVNKREQTLVVPDSRVTQHTASSAKEKNNQTFPETESKKQSEQTPLALSRLRCSFSIAGFFTYFFPFHFVLKLC